MPSGLYSGKKYEEKDIFNPIEYYAMKSEPLMDEEECLVVPVRNKSSPHFRRLTEPAIGRRLGREENNKTHDDCVNYIYNSLIDRSFRFSTYIFEVKPYEEQVIASSLPGSAYKWFVESKARIRFADGTYIQPDLAGRDTSLFSPTSANPSIIIEVIRTHEPELCTFQKLYDLSKVGYQIYLYFIAEGQIESRLNRLRTIGNETTVRTSYYLLDGVLHNNGKPLKSMEEFGTFEAWYNYLLNIYFIKSKEMVAAN